jgi:hypothetical protein
VEAEGSGAIQQGCGNTSRRQMINGALQRGTLGIDHVDPPAHFPENGITMDRIPLKQMVLPLVVPVIAATIENVTAAGHALPKVALRSPPTPICSASSSARLVAQSR